MTHTLFPAQQYSLPQSTGFVFKGLGKPLAYSGPFECRVRSGVLLCMMERIGAADIAPGLNVSPKCTGILISRKWLRLLMVVQTIS